MSQLTKNITLHQSFDEVFSKCLYCFNECGLSNSSGIYDSITSHRCKKCKERFIIYEDTKDFIHIVKSFRFTCNEFAVHIHYDTENFSISTDIDHIFFTNTSSYIWINDLENVHFEFDNKCKLYNKLKTYVVMA